MIVCAFNGCTQEADAGLLMGGVQVAPVCEAHGLVMGEPVDNANGDRMGFVLVPAQCHGLELRMRLSGPRPIIVETDR